MERGLTRNAIIQELTKSPHGDLKAFVPVGTRAAAEEAEFFAHLIAWNAIHGQVRDSKVALPVLSFMAANGHAEIVDNALAHLALLDPRNLLRALDFARTDGVKIVGKGRTLPRLVEKYLRVREADQRHWDRAAVQFRKPLKTLYARFHVKPSERADAVLFKGEKPKGSLFEAIAQLRTMTPTEAAGTILNKRIPFLIAMGAMGSRLKEPDVVLALINAMSPTELVTNTKMLERLGIKTNPALRGAYDAALQKVAKSKAATLKTTVAADQVEDEGLKTKLLATQEKQLAQLGGVDGNWLIAADRSPSMTEAIEVARHLAAVLARMVKGKVHVVFFDGGFYKYVDATGKDLDALTQETSRMSAGGGGTSIGSAVQYALDKGFEIDGIVIASDGAENTAPLFSRAYEALCKKLEKELPVYLYWLKCHMPNRSGNDPDTLARNMAAAEHDLQVIDLRGGFDYYSLPNIVKTMRTQRYGLAEQIMETPLLRLDEVLAS